MNGKKARKLRSMSKSRKEYRQLKKKYRQDPKFRRELWDSGKQS